MFIGQVVYISIIKAEVANKLIPVSMLSPPRLSYRYGWSFLAIVISFVSCEVAGTMAIFLFNYHHQGSCQIWRGQILGRAATWRRGFVNNFRRVPLACLGSREPAVTLRKCLPK